MEEINPTETLDPRRIAAKGRERRRRRQFAAVAGTAVFVLATAGTAYALSSGTSGKDAGLVGRGLVVVGFGDARRFPNVRLGLGRAR